MPGYLTSMAVLIEADKWLGDVEDALNKKDIFSRSKLDETILGLAHKVRNDYLRFEPSTPMAGFPPYEKTKIDNQVGNGLSTIAFAGAIGPDFIAAGNILALNQRWVADTLHKGAPRRAWKNAHTTGFVLYEPKNIEGVIRNPSNEVFTEWNRLYTTLRLGHLAGIAAHVIIQPFIRQWAWQHEAEPSTISKILPWPFGSDLNPGDPVRFAVHIDAKLAQGYFQRKDLHDGQSWTAYLPKDDKVVDFVCRRYLEGFSVTYGTDRPAVAPDEEKPAAILPRDPTCDFPPAADLAKQFADLGPLLDKYPKLKTKLTHWTGWPLGYAGFAYDDLFTDGDKDLDEATRTEINKAVDQIKGLQSKLTDYPCSTPTLDFEFLKDGFKNTRNWALDAGYDHYPWVISLIMSAVVAFTSLNPINAPDDASAFVKLILKVLGFGVTENVWSATVGFDGSDDVKKTNRDAWIKDGLANEIIWFDMFDNGYGSNGLPLFFFSAVLTGVSFLNIDGLFGQNADALAGLRRYQWRKLYVLFNDLFSPIVLFPLILNDAVVDWYRKPVVRWFFYWVVNVGFDGFEALFVNRPNPTTGLQGDPVGLRIWYLRLWLTGSFVLSSALAFGVKAGDSRENPSPDLTARDYLLGLVFPAVVIAAIVWWKSGFEGALLQAVTGIEWPSSSTNLVDDLLAVEQKNGVKSLKEATPQPVALFASLTEADEVTPDGKSAKNSYFPEAPAATKFAELPAADNQARKEAHIESPPYQLKQLFDRAAMFAGLLSMALVNYDAADSGAKAIAGQIYQDWNLDFRTEQEWNDLMELRSDKKPGLLKAAENWWKATSTGTAVNADDVEQLEIALGIRGAPTASSITLEDRSVAPNNKKTDTAHIPLGGLAYTIVDASGATVASGTTDATGALQQALSAGAEYEIRIADYDGIAG